MNRVWGLLLVVVSLMVAGCDDGPGIASVEGTVTMDDKPLPNATVIFTPAAGGRPAAGRTDSEGKYKLNFSAGRKGAIPGINKVRLTTKADPYENEDGTKVPASPETVPMEYNQQSTLEFNVEDGKVNVADFQLKSGGKVFKDQPGGY